MTFKIQKTVALLLVFVFVFISLASCGDISNQSDDASSTDDDSNRSEYSATSSETSSATSSDASSDISSDAESSDDMSQTPVISQVKHNIVALGDSITAGYGLDDPDVQKYTSLLADKLSKEYDGVNMFNYAVSGHTTDDMLSLLKAGTAETLADADTVIICIGANNVLVPIGGVVFGVLEQCRQNIFEIAAKLLKGQDASQERAAVNSALQSLADELTNGETAQKVEDGVEKFKTDLPLIIDEIRRVNPDCDIYFGNIYNPYAHFDICTLVDSEFDMPAYSDGVVQKLNLVIASFAETLGYTVVDIHSVFASTDDLNVNAVCDLSKGLFNYDPHPNAAGHEVIAEVYYQIYKDLLSAEVLCATKPAVHMLSEAINMQNVAYNKTYTIETGEPVSCSYTNYEPEFYNNDIGQLTDGNIAKLDSSDNAWLRSMRGGSRIVTVDLGDQYAVSGFECSFLQSKAEAFYAPRNVKVMISPDGKNYMTVCVVGGDDLSTNIKSRATRSGDFDKAYEARYVKIEYTVDIFAACDEIKIYGSLDGERAQITPDDEQAEAEMSTDICGASSFIKLYNGYYPADQSIADLTRDKLLPYIAYIDGDGNIADTMFDGAIFVPCHTDYPSGGRLTKTNGKPGAVMSDWMLYLENTFDGTKNLASLDSTVGEVYKALGIDKKMPVLLTMPYPTIIDGVFGDIDGDGKAEYCRTLDERLDIIKWYADICLQKFNEAEYENIEFVGFYWYREEVNYSDSDHEDRLCILANEYFHSKGLKSLYDPFYLSTGYDHYRTLGFDTCVMQPNYAEISSDRTYFKSGMLDEFAVTVKNAGCGVEIETLSPYAYTDGTDYINAAQNYLEYLYTGVDGGYDKNLKTWYQGAGPGSIYSFCHADVSSQRGMLLRSLYDATYKFIKGTLTREDLTVSGDTTVSGSAGTRIRGDFSVTGGYAALMQYTVSLKPLHGSVDVYAGGYKYVAEPDFAGSDMFEITVSDGISAPSTLKINVTVTQDDSDIPSVDNNGTEDTEKTDDAKPGKTDFILPIALAAALCAVVLFIKKRKNKK